MLMTWNKLIDKKNKTKEQQLIIDLVTILNLYGEYSHMSLEQVYTYFANRVKEPMHVGL